MLCESLLGALGGSSNNIDCIIVFQFFYLINPPQTINTAGKLIFFLLWYLGEGEKQLLQLFFRPPEPIFSPFEIVCLIFHLTLILWDYHSPFPH